MIERRTASTIISILRGMEGPVRDSLGIRSDQLAFKKAIKGAVKSVRNADPTIANELFEKNFTRHQAAPLMAQYLLGVERTQLVEELTLRWYAQYKNKVRNMAVEKDRTRTAVEVFFDSLDEALARWGPTHQTIALRAATKTAAHVEEISRAMSGPKFDSAFERAYLDWLISRNLYLDARGTLQT